ncbi:MAG: FkbM family methyltransferase [Thermoanaerobaculia bacterium]
MSAKWVYRWHAEGWLAKLLLGYSRRMPDHPAKIRLFTFLASTCFPHGMPVCSSSGVRLRVDVRDYIGHSICVGGGYEPQSLDLATRLMSAGGIFVDVGCNFGLYTCSIAANSKSGVVAIDASPAALVKLQDNLVRNRLTSVTVVSAAIQSKRSLAVLEAPPPTNLGATRISSRLRSRIGGANLVAAIPLGEVLLSLEVGPIHLMKIDVEGSELEVLAGLDFSASYRPRNIIMEHSERVASSASDVNRCFALLLAEGYAPHKVDGEVFELGGLLPEENVWWTGADPTEPANAASN